MAFILFIILIYTYQLSEVWAISLREISVPSIIQAGEEAVLLCDVDMESDILYSLTWYKDNEEFFRYVPRNSPKYHVFNVTGVFVNITGSDSRKVILNKVSLSSSGLYRCEVTAEGPSFSSVNGKGRMEVVVLPSDGPVISGTKSVARAGDLIHVNCTSAASKPATHLRWYINGKKANHNYVKEYKAVTGEDGLETTVLGLTFTVHENHLKDHGRLSLRCEAAVGTENVLNPPAASTTSLGGMDKNKLDNQAFTFIEVSEIHFMASESASFSAESRWINFICIVAVVNTIPYSIRPFL